MPVSISHTEDFPATVSGPAAGDPRVSSSVRAMGAPLASRTLWLWKRLQDVVGTFAPLGSNAPIACSADATADTITVTSHGLSNADPVVFVLATGAALPSPLVAGRSYFVVSAATDTFKVADSAGGAAINLTSTGSGNWFVAKRVTPSLYGYALLAAALNVFDGGASFGNSVSVTGTVNATGAVTGATGVFDGLTVNGTTDIGGDLTVLNGTTSVSELEVAGVALASTSATSGATKVGVFGNVGVGLTFVSGTLQAVLNSISDTAASIASLASTVTNSSGSALVGIDAYNGAITTIVGGTIRTLLRTLADFALRSDINLPVIGRSASTISASSTNPVISAAQPLYEHHINAAIGGVVVCSVADYTGTAPANPEIELVVSSANGDDSNPPAYSVVRATGGHVLATAVFKAGAASHAGIARFRLRWRAGAWHLVGFDATPYLYVLVSNVDAS